jgi:hypothetical protein
MNREEVAQDLYQISSRRFNFNLPDGFHPTVGGEPLSTGTWDSVEFKYAAGTFVTEPAPATTALVYTSTVPPVLPSWVSLGAGNNRIDFHERGLYFVHVNMQVTPGAGADVLLHTRMSNGALEYQSVSQVIPGGMTLVAQASSAGWFIHYPGDGDYFTQIFMKAVNYPSLVGAAPTYDASGEVQIFHMLTSEV